MKFKSKKDILYTILFVGVSIILIGIAVFDFITEEMENYKYWPMLIIFITVGLLFWIYFGTNYELSKDGLIYKSGPFNGKISINRIKEVVVSKTLWVGFRPATSRKGLILKYDLYNEIYISPKNNKLFVEKLLELNSKIKITH